MPSHTYYFDSEEEIELKLTSPAYPATREDDGSPAEWDIEHITFLGVPCTRSPSNIALALWPDDAEKRTAFLRKYNSWISAAEKEADETENCPEDDSIYQISRED